MSLKVILTTSALLAAQLVSGHAAIIKAVGDAGGSGMAIGVDPNTPRDGTRRRPFQADSTRFRGASANSVGETIGAGTNDAESGTAKVMDLAGGTLPQITPGGSLQMTVHQVNADGAGPFKCMINSDGTAQSWENIQVTTNVAGNQRGRNNAGSASDHPLVAAIPADQTCTGQVAGQDNVCMVRCQNPANAGPFGGVVPVQMANAAGAGNGTAPATGNTGKTGNAGNTGNTGNTGNAPVGNTGNTGNTPAGNTGNAGNRAGRAGRQGGRNNNNNAGNDAAAANNRARAVEFTA